MQDFSFRLADEADAPALAALANRYTWQHLTAQQRQGGFLSGSFSAPLLQAWLASAPGVVAYCQQALAGFIITSKLAPAAYPPLVQEIYRLLPTLYYRQRPLTQYEWVFYGPVLIEQQYRGQGLLTRLFKASVHELRARYTVGIAFIAEQNTASMRAHVHTLGLQVVGRLIFKNESYALLVFPIT